MGCRFIVQSPKQSSEYIINSLNVFLDEHKKLVETISDKDFKAALESVLVRTSEKDYNLGMDCTRMSTEITTHKYLFDSPFLSIRIGLEYKSGQKK